MPEKKISPDRTIKDRRRVNRGVGIERRGTAEERRRCPDCGGVLWTSVRRRPTGTKTTMACVKRGCQWSTSSAQVDSKYLTLKLTWDLPVEKMGGSWVVELPKQVVRALDLRSGDNLTFKPLTLPVGSQKMRWGVTTKKKKAKGRKT